MSGNKEKLDGLFTLYHSVLDAVGEITAQGQDLKDIFRKAIAVSVASYFEVETKSVVLSLAKDLIGRQGKILTNLIENRILDRGYHTLFAWKDPKPNAKMFYSFFSSKSVKFTDFMRGKEKEDGEFAAAAACFVELGQARNILVHNDLAAVPFDLSIEEIEEKYKKAQKFLPKFRIYALEFAKQHSGE